MSLPCPNAEQLAALLRGALADAEQAAFEHHVESCASCQNRLEALAAGALQGTPRLPPTSHPQPLDQAVRNLRAGGLTSASESPPDPLLSSGTAPRNFGEYEIFEELGRGGMGVVYRARHVGLNRPVALKLILAGQLASASEIRRFRNEAEAAARLDHPNIVPIYEIGEHDGRHYFSMKLVEGASLAARVADVRTTKSHRDIAQLVALVGRAIHYAHQRGILHRDLKPANILLDTSDQPHLTDFGLAKFLEQESGVTHSQAIMGTPDYMSPEIAAGKAKEVTTAADVFSLGAILYELLTGSPPFHEASATATIQKVLHAEPRRPRTIDATVSRDLETIALKCLEKEPARRYASAAAVAEDLERFARGETILARPVSSPERIVRWAKRKPALAALTLALFFVLMLGLVGVISQWRRAEQNAENAQAALTRLEIEQADSLLQTTDSAKGLAHLARSLRRQPDNRVAAERLLSALTLRPIGLPVAPLRHGPALNSWKTNEQTKLSPVFPFCFTGSVVAANFSPEGRRVVTASEDGTARIWDTLTGEPVGQPLKHAAEVLWAEFSPDGARVVTASMDFTARVWDASTGAPLSPPLAHNNIVWHAAFSPDGREVISASEDHTARIWNPTTGEPSRSLMAHKDPVIYAAFSPDGHRVVTADRTFTAVLWERDSGEILRRMMHHFTPEGATAFPRFNARGDQLLNILNQTVNHFDLENPSANEKRFTADSSVRAVAFVADPRRFAMAAGSQVRVMDIATGRRVMTLSHRDTILSLQPSSDGRRLVTASADRTVRVSDLKQAGRVLTTLSHETVAITAALSADQRRLLSVPAADTAWLWQMRTGPAAVVCSNAAAIHGVWFSPDGERVLGATARSSIVWESSSGRQLSRPGDELRLNTICMDAHFGNGEVRALRVASLNPSSLTPMFGGPKVYVRNVMKPDGAGVELINRARAFGARFSPDGRSVVTAWADGTAAIWDAISGERRFLLTHAAAVNSVGFSPDGKWIATGSADKTARVWNAATGQPITQPLRHEAGVKFVLFDPTGEKLATACDDGTIHFWSPQTGTETTPQVVLLPDLQHQRTCCFSPDGSRLAVAVAASVQLWDTTTGKSAVGPLEMSTVVTAVRFSPDGRRIVVAKTSGEAVILDAATGQAVSEPLQHDGPVTDAKFSPDGTRVATCSSDRTVRIWPVPTPPLPAPMWLPELAEAIAGQRLNNEDVSEVVPVETLYRLRQKLTSEPASDYYRKWAQWFFADSATRQPLPRADTK